MGKFTNRHRDAFAFDRIVNFSLKTELLIVNKSRTVTGNGFTGTIPSYFGNLQSLKRLYILERIIHE